MNASIADHELSVIRFYRERTDDFYLRRWDGEDIHFGIFLEGETVDLAQYAAGQRDSLKRSLRRMTEVVTAPAQIRSTDIVVDAGCGVGGTAMYLARNHGCRVIGINLSEHQIGIARQKAKEAGLDYLVRFEYGDCSTHLPLEDGSANVIVNIESACHYSDRERFLDECARILRPGGRLVAQDVVAKDGIDQQAWVAAACDSWAMHAPLETPHSYRRLLEKSGFAVLELDEIEGFGPTIDLMDQSANHFRRALAAGHALTDEEHTWLRQFETMARAEQAGHLTLLRYHATRIGQ